MRNFYSALKISGKLSREVPYDDGMSILVLKIFFVLSAQNLR